MLCFKTCDTFDYGGEIDVNFIDATWISRYLQKWDSVNKPINHKRQNQNKMQKCIVQGVAMHNTMLLLSALHAMVQNDDTSLWKCPSL